MNAKILKLLMFFLLTSLFVSSKESSEKKDARCIIKCLSTNETILEGGGKQEDKNADYPFSLAPASYMFRY